MNIPTFGENIKYLALPAAAASSERAFSIAELIIFAKQASLDPDLHFVHENWEHVFTIR